jgi:hypothetical protein
MSHPPPEERIAALSQSSEGRTESPQKRANLIETGLLTHKSFLVLFCGTPDFFLDDEPIEFIRCNDRSP